MVVLDYVYRLRDGVFINKGLSKLESAIFRGIVNNDHFEIGVILVVDGLDIVLVAEVLIVVASGYHHAEWQLG